MTEGAYLVHLHAPFGHAQHYLGWSANRTLRLGHHAAGTGSNLLRHVRLAGISWSLVRVWPGATRTGERGLHNRGSAARLCPACQASRPRAVVQLPAGGYLEEWAVAATQGVVCCAPGCWTLATYRRPWGRGQRGLCELHACAYAARQYGAEPFTTARAPATP